MERRRRLGSILALVLLAPAPGAVARANAVEPMNDVRIVIDVSGSMKRNDPHNLRVPALRLLTNLLPAGTRGGVWIYGRSVNPLVPLRSIDSVWKATATAAAAKIHSLEQFTNIPDALVRAAEDWHGADPASRRHVILLTDGLVDVSKNAVDNAVARARVLDEILPKLKRDGARIHAVALSPDADHVLLKRLAETTNGHYAQVDSAAKLERVFLKLFEQATRPDTLPLKDNQVQVDASIKELTLLVFRQDGARPTRVKPPQGEEFGQGALPKNVTWHSEKHYDLITVAKPVPGTWKILADVDPDNRVLVVTDLKVKATDLPVDITLDEPVLYFAQLLQRGEVITDRRFLGVVKMQLASGNALRDVHDDGRDPDAVAADGTYSVRLGALNEGKQELVLTVDGRTFQRELRHAINVHKEPVQVLVAAGERGRHVLTVKPRFAVIDPVGLTLTANIDGQPPTAVPRAEDDIWRMALPEGAHTLRVSVRGRRVNGAPYAADLGPWRYGGQAAKLTHTDAAQAPTARGSPNGWIVAAQVGAANLMAGGAWWFISRRRRKRSVASPAERLTL